jgi:hypothetical protein
MEDVADQDETKNLISREELIKIVQYGSLKLFRLLIEELH